MEKKDSENEEETKTDSEDDELVLEGILLEENRGEEKVDRIRCRCYVGCFVLWALVVYFLTDYYVSRIYMR